MNLVMAMQITFGSRRLTATTCTVVPLKVAHQAATLTAPVRAFKPPAYRTGTTISNRYSWVLEHLRALIPTRFWAQRFLRAPVIGHSSTSGGTKISSLRICNLAKLLTRVSYPTRPPMNTVHFTWLNQTLDCQRSPMRLLLLQ